ncbi:MAG: hypothetical protein Q4B77_06995 [Coriobacteriaceae bacterium]|nr:hypothetical protein [Coriobacteriaceae bacterium]
MMELFDCGAVLFESREGEESLRIECAVTPEGALEVLQESDGPLTSWCFEESPHRIEALVEPLDLKGLMEYLHADDPRQLPAILRFEYTGYDCFMRLRGLLKRLGVPYTVFEAAIVR